MSKQIDPKKEASCPTPHNEAKYGDFADVCLMPGDPLRSKLVATEFLENAKLVNNVRNIQGYTGTYKGKEVSVMASGMGQPSIGIYSFELYRFYDVDTIIRIGSCGGYTPTLHAGDLIIAMAACTDGGFPKQFDIDGNYAPIADPYLTSIAANLAYDKGYNYECGNIMSSDRFYTPFGDIKNWQRMGVLGVEMESAALYCNAAFLGKRALTICSVSDSFIYPEENMTAEERQNSFTNMIELALETALEAKTLGPVTNKAKLPDLI